MAEPAHPEQEQELTRSFRPVTNAEMIHCRTDRAVLTDAWLLIQDHWTPATIVRWRQLQTGTWAAHALWRPGWAAWVHYDTATIKPRTSAQKPPWGQPAGHPDMSHLRTVHRSQ